MITARWTAVVLSFLVLRADSQVRHPVLVQRGDLSLIHGPAALRAPLSDGTLRVLAVRVQFKVDADVRTSGDGQFDLTTPRPELPDPPPHDSAYFSGKLQFLSNYYQKASNGSLTVAGTILPGLVTLDEPMATYSPKDQGNAPIAQLFIDAWSRAVAQQPSFPFDQFDAFVLFHAGVGRDVDLVSLLGYDPTPNDIPSLYVSLSSLREFLGDQSFPGVEVPASGFYITSSLILPETETRILDTGLGRDTLRLSMNGITAATMGNHLGLPDLFDVTTGRSGIGQFGLMDGAGIFAFNGLFPPEPSAWEKYYLGWLTPIDVSQPLQVLTVPAVGLITSGADTVYRIPISPDEYYLVENRQRDPDGNGQTLTVMQYGVPVELHFQGDTAGFSFDDISAIHGSVIDVEDLDWATPGSTQQQGFEGGGILIWHIDENIIRRGMASNTVNADPSRRGVDLEEADGSQDIGQVYEMLQAGSGTQFGWPLDLWFDGNQSPVYANRFDERSSPNTLSNSGAHSLITVKDFGQRSARMTVAVEIGSGGFQVIEGLRRTLSAGMASAAPTASPSGIYLNSSDTLYAVRSDGRTKTAAENGMLGSGSGPFSPAVLERGPGWTLLAAVRDSALVLYDLRDGNGDGVFESIATSVVALGGAASSAPSFLVSPTQFAVVIGLSDGSYAWVDSLLHVSAVHTGASSSVTQFAVLPSSYVDSLPTPYALAGGRLSGAGAVVDLPAGEGTWSIAGFTSPGGNHVIAVGMSGARMLVFDPQLSVAGDITLPPDSLRGLAVGDLDGDGRKEVVLSGVSSLRAFNESGFPVDGFPIAAPQGNAFVSSPLIGDLDGDGSPDIVVVTSGGALYGYSNAGQLLSGFPIQGFDQGSCRLGLFSGPQGNVALLGVTSQGEVNAFETSQPYTNAAVVWSQELADARHLNADLAQTAGPTPISSEFFPRSRVYNWPNPVYGEQTQIRFFVAEDAAISVKIFDLTGISVAELKTSASGGLDGEITWNVRDVDSGVYLARIQASSQTKTEVAIIKIAIVK